MRETHREGHVKMEAQTNYAITAKKLHQSPEVGRGKEGSSSRAFYGSDCGTANTLIPDFWTPEL